MVYYPQYPPIRGVFLGKDSLQTVFRGVGGKWGQGKISHFHKKQRWLSPFPPDEILRKAQGYAAQTGRELYVCGDSDGIFVDASGKIDSYGDLLRLDAEREE